MLTYDCGSGVAPGPDEPETTNMDIAPGVSPISGQPDVGAAIPVVTYAMFQIRQCARASLRGSRRVPFDR